MDDKQVLDILYSKSRFKRGYKEIIESNIELKEYLDTRYKDSASINETLYRILHNVEERPVCRFCGSPATFNKGKFNDICVSKTCIRRKVSEHNLEKYGVTNISHIKEVRNKISSILKNKSTEEKRLMLDKRKSTCQSLYGVNNCWQSEEKKEKIRQTCLEKYGVENGGGSMQSIEKIKRTKFERHGDPNYTNTEKMKQTCLERYGVENTSQLKSTINKIENTMLNKYGVKNYTQSEEYKLRHNEIETKKNNTHKENNSFNVSRKEDMCYEILKEKFPDIIRQYRSKEYPFNCDFYIPSKDLYIEFQGSWVHGKHPFDETDEDDVKKLELWKARTEKSRYYKNAIHTWTIRDIRKRNMAKENHLNYIELWNLDEARQIKILKK